ncbi:MAG: WbqC family protein [Candidatus Handelsmanbacteria bacterium]|nr:WbqC family protein [Candidatus Handelsmanbacteria bacterium]
MKTPQGVQWLKVPVSGEYLALIAQVGVDPGEGWRRKHLESLRHAYHRAPHGHSPWPG